MNPTIPYSIVSRSLVFEATQVIVEFDRDLMFEGALCDLAQFMRDNRLTVPLAAWILGPNGPQRHGLYACIKVMDADTAIHLSAMKGHPFPIGDGATYASRTALAEDYNKLKGYGCNVTPDALAWGITAEPFEFSNRKPPIAALDLPL